MILSAIAERLKRRSKDDFKGRHFEASLILQAVAWYLRYSLSYRDIEELFRQRADFRSGSYDSHIGFKQVYKPALLAERDRSVSGCRPSFGPAENYSHKG